MDDIKKQKHEQEIRKSKVRVWVTYAMTLAYAIAALGLIGWLMVQQKTELAIGVFSGLASTSASIIAFWFGSRGSARTQDPEEERS
ncbi:hypothetical protein [Candidatus Palauibacter sp.]|uniref:hypothetical protein n=1 Tax=Candidatus Palauibacter sp. TaxID=3101350 RepID=UPI003AF262F2